MTNPKVLSCFFLLLLASCGGSPEAPQGVPVSDLPPRPIQEEDNNDILLKLASSDALVRDSGVEAAVKKGPKVVPAVIDVISKKDFSELAGEMEVIRRLGASAAEPIGDAFERIDQNEVAFRPLDQVLKVLGMLDASGSSQWPRVAKLIEKMERRERKYPEYAQSSAYFAFAKINFAEFQKFIEEKNPKNTWVGFMMACRKLGPEALPFAPLIISKLNKPAEISFADREVFTLGGIRYGVTPLLLEALKDATPALQNSTDRPHSLRLVRALQSMPLDDTPLMIKALSETDLEIERDRYLTFWFGVTKVLATRLQSSEILSLLQDSNPVVQMNAIRILGFLPSKPSSEILHVAKVQIEGWSKEEYKSLPLQLKIKGVNANLFASSLLNSFKPEAENILKKLSAL